jgi:Tfp pilus assembly protein PilN
MIRTNLSTRPFYNVTAVRVILGVIALLALAITVFHVIHLLSLRANEAVLSARATEALEEADRLRADAARIRAQVDPRELQQVASAASEANGVIARRAFSWTRFLTQIEATLPADVRVTAIEPRVEDGQVRVAIDVEAQRAADLASFMDALEGESTFRNVVPARSVYAEDGVLEASILGEYVPEEIEP